MSKVTPAEARDRRFARAAQQRRRQRPTADLGQQVRALRQAAGFTHATFAAKAKMRQAQVSVLENGYNVESRQYQTVARVLGYRGALEMFRADPTDPRLSHFLRGWALLTEDQQARVLRFLNRLVLGDEA